MTRSVTTLRAAIWAFAATMGARAITLAALAILARMLAPRDFGLLAFALVYLTYAETVGDLGTTVALIYWPDRREDVAQLTFLVNVAMGLAWFFLTLALAPVIASFFDNPEAIPIIRTLAFAFLIKFLGNTHDGLAQKDLRFRARAIPELGLAATKALISIALAVAGFGVWSLVWGHLAGLAAWTVGAWAIVPWRPRFSIPRGLFRPMVRYGRGIVVVNVIAAVVHHADLIVVGKMLGPAALGFYQIAYKIPEATITVVIWVAAKVLFPAFSRLEGSIDDLRRAYLKALQYVSFVTVPMAAGLFVSARPLVLVFFGSRWEAAIPLLQWLAVYMGVRSLGTHAGDILKATGRSGLLAGLGVVKAAVLIPALIAAGNVSAQAVAMALTAVTVGTSLLNVAVAQRILRFSAWSAVRAVSTSVVAGAGLVAAGLLLAPAVRPLGPAAELSMVVAVCGAVYVAVAAAMDAGLVAGLMGAFPRRGQQGVDALEVKSWR